MKIVLQRVKSAQVKVDSDIVGSISRGLLIFLGVGKGDTDQDVDYLARKISQLRIFSDPKGKMNCSADEVGASFLVVSQFTLLGDCEKGRRPSFDKAALPEQAVLLYNKFVDQLKNFKI